MSVQILNRFFSKIEELPGENSCHIWMAAKSPQGYGIFNIGEHTLIGAHVFAYILYYKIYPKYNVHHICENRKCVNPLHLQDVTVSKHRFIHYNNKCRRGHELTPENTILSKKGRCCKICQNVSRRNYRKRTGI